MACGCEATIDEKDPRAEIWKYVFGKTSFPLKHPLLKGNANFPNKTFYSGDASALTPEQKVKLVEAMTKKFNIRPADVKKSFKGGVIPILSDNVILSICELHMRCMVFSDDEESDEDENRDEEEELEE